MKVFVTDGAQNHALAVARSLGAKGVEVVVGESSLLSKGGFSRYCRQRKIYPSPTESVSAFLTWMVDEMKRGGYDFLLPMTEGCLLPISANRDDFLPHVRLPLPSHDAIFQACNKAETLSLAQREGIPIPKTWFMEDLTELPSLAKTISYPVVIKPRWSFYWKGDRMTSGGGAAYAFGPEELIEKVRRIHQEIPFPLIQSFVPGRGYGLYALFEQGRPRVLFAHERLRDVRPTGSGSALRRSIPPDPVLTKHAVALLNALKWHGVAMVEFKWERGRSEPVLMEVNGRFWNSLPLAIAAGVDFPWLLLEMAQGKPFEDFPAYQTDLLCRWFLGDCRHLFAVWRGAPPGWPAPFPKRGETLLAFLKSHRRGMVYDTFRWEDPLPGLIEWLYFAFTKVPGYFRKSRGRLAKHAEPV